MKNYAPESDVSSSKIALWAWPSGFLKISIEKSHCGNCDFGMTSAGTTVAKARDDKKARRVVNRVRLFGWSCKALWGRRLTSEKWRLFRGNGVADISQRAKRQGC